MHLRSLYICERACGLQSATPDEILAYNIIIFCCRIEQLFAITLALGQSLPYLRTRRASSVPMYAILQRSLSWDLRVRAST